MVERDTLTKAYQASTPIDLEDPPQFGQAVEIARDALTIELRSFFNQPQLNLTDVSRRREIPTVRKYAVGFGPGTDPYATVQQIVQDHADLNEKLPHVAVTAVQGRNNRMTIGSPYVLTVQIAPYVESIPGPFALGAPAREVWTVEVSTAVVGQTYRVDVLGLSFAYTAILGDTPATIAQGLRDALRAIQLSVAIARVEAVLTLTAVDINTPLMLTVGPGLSSTLVTAAGGSVASVLAFRGPRNQEARMTLDPVWFPAPGAVTAAQLASVLNARHFAVYAEARPDGRVRFTWHKPSVPPAFLEIEVLPETSSVFGLGVSGAGYVASGLNVTDTGLGLAATAAIDPDAGAEVWAYATFAGQRRRIVTVVDDNTVTIDTPVISSADAWFIGRRDTWRNVSRPVMNRRHMSLQMTVNASILAESPSERDELHDLVLTHFAYYLEKQHSQLFGRGTFDPETYTDEHWQISFAQDIAPSGQTVVAREGDTKNPIYEARINIPITLWLFQDRAVLVPYGPRTGQSFVVEGADIQALDSVARS